MKNSNSKNLIVLKDFFNEKLQAACSFCIENQTIYDKLKKLNQINNRLLL
jgi:hypothetical protein